MSPSLQNARITGKIQLQTPFRHMRKTEKLTPWRRGLYLWPASMASVSFRVTVVRDYSKLDSILWTCPRSLPGLPPQTWKWSCGEGMLPATLSPRKTRWSTLGSSAGPADFTALDAQAGEASARPCQGAKRKSGCCQAGWTTGWSSAEEWGASSLLPVSFLGGFFPLSSGLTWKPLPPSECVLGDSGLSPPLGTGPRRVATAH